MVWNDNDIVFFPPHQDIADDELLTKTFSLREKIFSVENDNQIVIHFPFMK